MSKNSLGLIVIFKHCQAIRIHLMDHTLNSGLFFKGKALDDLQKLKQKQKRLILKKLKQLKWRVKPLAIVGSAAQTERQTFLWLYVS